MPRLAAFAGANDIQYYTVVGGPIRILQAIRPGKDYMLSRKMLRELLIGGLTLLILIPAPLRASQADALAALEPARPADHKSSRPGEKKPLRIPLILTVADGLPPRLIESDSTEPLVRDPALVAVASGLGWTNRPPSNIASAGFLPEFPASILSPQFSPVFRSLPLGRLNDDPASVTRRALRCTRPSLAPPQG